MSRRLMRVARDVVRTITLLKAGLELEVIAAHPKRDNELEPTYVVCVKGRSDCEYSGVPASWLEEVE